MKEQSAINGLMSKMSAKLDQFMIFMGLGSCSYWWGDNEEDVVISSLYIMDHLQSWCLVLERTFLTFNWSEHAKKHTYMRRTYFTPREIESLIFEYLRGGNPYIGEFDGLTKVQGPIFNAQKSKIWQIEGGY